MNSQDMASQIRAVTIEIPTTAKQSEYLRWENSIEAMPEFWEEGGGRRKNKTVTIELRWMNVVHISS